MVLPTKPAPAPAAKSPAALQAKPSAVSPRRAEPPHNSAVHWNKLLPALSIWVIEAFIGAIPLLLHDIVHVSINPSITTWLVFYDQFGKQHSVMLPDTPLSEICVLSVVTNGLSLLVAGRNIRKIKSESISGLIFLFVLMSLICLVIAALFYEQAARGDYVSETLAWLLFVAGLFFSAFLTGIVAVSREP